MTPKNNIVIGVIVGLVVIASYNMDADPAKFFEGIPNLGIIFNIASLIFLSGQVDCTVTEVSSFGGFF